MESEHEQCDNDYPPSIRNASSIDGTEDEGIEVQEAASLSPSSVTLRSVVTNSFDDGTRTNVSPHRQPARPHLRPIAYALDFDPFEDAEGRPVVVVASSRPPRSKASWSTDSPPLSPFLSPPHLKKLPLSPSKSAAPEVRTRLRAFSEPFQDSSEVCPSVTLASSKFSL